MQFGTRSMIDWKNSISENQSKTSSLSRIFNHIPNCMKKRSYFWYLVLCARAHGASHVLIIHFRERERDRRKLAARIHVQYFHAREIFLDPLHVLRLVLHIARQSNIINFSSTHPRTISGLITTLQVSTLKLPFNIAIFFSEIMCSSEFGLWQGSAWEVILFYFYKRWLNGAKRNEQMYNVVLTGICK